MLLRLVRPFLLWLFFICFVGPLSAADHAEYEQAIASWARVLTGFVDEQGQTDFIALSKQKDELQAYVEFVAKVSPSTHPALFQTREEMLAYHINTYNALAMYGVIEEGIPKDFDSFFKRLSFFKLRDIEIGGEITSLYDYENDVIRAFAEPRVHFALNCMVKDCPRLPRRVFSGKSLELDLEGLTREFFNKNKHLRLDEENKRVYVSEILDFYTEDFVNTGDEQDLLPYINHYRSIPIPDAYRLRFIDYDWTINQQP